MSFYNIFQTYSNEEEKKSVIKAKHELIYGLIMEHRQKDKAFSLELKL